MSEPASGRSGAAPHSSGLELDRSASIRLVNPAVLEELSWLLRPAGGGVYLVSTGRREQQALQRRFYAAETEADVSQRFLESLEQISNARVVMLGVPADV